MLWGINSLFLSRDEESDRLMSQLPSSAPTNQPPGLVKEIHWWDKSQGGSYRRRKKQKEIQRWLKSIPWGSYLNMPTLAAIAGLSVGYVLPTFAGRGRGKGGRRIALLDSSHTPVLPGARPSSAWCLSSASMVSFLEYLGAIF